MQEWDVVGVIAALVALFTAVLAPMMKLVQAIARLTATIEHLEKNTECIVASNRTAHEHLWERAQEHTTRIYDHEARIRVMEET